METLEEIQRALERLTVGDRLAIACWLQEFDGAGARKHAWGSHFVCSPRLVIEILSPSTQLTDRREKLQNYRLIDSVDEYVLAAQDERKLTVYRRADGWRPQVCTGGDATAEFRSIGLMLPLNKVYDDILSD
jgi:Uma2 family endonuclease